MLLSADTSNDAAINNGTVKVVGGEVPQTLNKGANQSDSSSKRIIDIVVSLLALLVSAPVLVMIAILIKSTTHGPIFFRQTRTGYRGRPFRIIKFRTMTVIEDGDMIAHACRGDMRVTPVGRFLRGTSLDEIPQLFNILLGDMSLVGPRPHALAHDRHYSALLDGYNNRFLVKPGLTGLAQVRGLRGEIHDLSYMARRLDADVEYIRRWTPLFDIAIIFQTVPKMVRDRSAY
ncbi:putative colanic acid biosynthesis UDP-glucose lipid carrier transferase [Sphingomonas faeni]|uniref:Putative colanic acid biosynthesis UDP-glucose lipid carrier transferase n=1 Tax=Sphingomonas faeni TaxID=185950 RepID=A0A2T5TY67_9SPHN|nr:sugar transferase [Sphingomonas faeni]PTW44194.1 putative colanic acid biosynthesis UDP-glucose lipid carrier transferase [Sphingomonas faeni]